MKYYLAGPMTGIPKFNIPLFEFAAFRLRAAGHEVVSPAELDSPAVRRVALASPDGKVIDGMVAGETWGDMLARDVKIIADQVDGVIFLDGWHKSRGARLEAFVGLLCNKQFATYDPRGVDPVMPLSTEAVRAVTIRFIP